MQNALMKLSLRKSRMKEQSRRKQWQRSLFESVYRWIGRFVRKTIQNIENIISTSAYTIHILFIFISSTNSLTQSVPSNVQQRRRKTEHTKNERKKHEHTHTRSVATKTEINQAEKER